MKVRVAAPEKRVRQKAVTAVKDSHAYPTGSKVTDQELKSLHLIRDAFHGEWNYTFKPQDPDPDGHII